MDIILTLSFHWSVYMWFIFKKINDTVSFKSILLLFVLYLSFSSLLFVFLPSFRLIKFLVF